MKMRIMDVGGRGMQGGSEARAAEGFTGVCVHYRPAVKGNVAQTSKPWAGMPNLLLTGVKALD